jgi:hypothetical protein
MSRCCIHRAGTKSSSCLITAISELTDAVIGIQACKLQLPHVVTPYKAQRNKMPVSDSFSALETSAHTAGPSST